MGAREAGFTLLEALAALAIVAIGFGFAFGAFPESLRAQKAARTLQDASTLAESLLAEAGKADGVAPGQAGGFAWRIDTAPIVASGGSTQGQDIQVTVSWPEDGRIRSIAVRSVRLRDAAP